MTSQGRAGSILNYHRAFKTSTKTVVLARAYSLTYLLRGDNNVSVFVCFGNRGGRDFNVEAGEQAMGPQLTVLSETEAAALVAKRPDAASSVANVAAQSSFLSHDNSSYLPLQQPPFKLKGANKGVQLQSTIYNRIYNQQSVFIDYHVSM